MNDRHTESTSPEPPSTGQAGARERLDAELGETLPGGGPPLHPAAGVSPAGSPPESEAADDEYGPPPKPWIIRSALLFLATCVSTFWVGASHFMPMELMSSAGGL